jgi:hypothetical protein
LHPFISRMANKKKENKILIFLFISSVFFIDYQPGF